MDQLELIGRLMDLEPPLYLVGGYAEEKVLPFHPLQCPAWGCHSLAAFCGQLK